MDKPGGWVWVPHCLDEVEKRARKIGKDVWVPGRSKLKRGTVCSTGTLVIAPRDYVVLEAGTLKKKFVDLCMLEIRVGMQKGLWDQ